jgi:hypothetical protein
MCNRGRLGSAAIVSQRDLQPPRLLHAGRPKEGHPRPPHVPATGRPPPHSFSCVSQLLLLLLQQR